MSLASNPAFSKAISVAGTGPFPITLGSTPAQPIDLIVANGLSPASLAFSRDIKSIAPPPEFNGDEFPAVIFPFRLKAGFKVAVFPIKIEKASGSWVRAVAIIE